jgi:hypothetical protein
MVVAGSLPSLISTTAMAIARAAHFPHNSSDAAESWGHRTSTARAADDRSIQVIGNDWPE